MAFPGSYNFNYYRGDTAEFVVRPKTANGDAFDLTGFNSDFFIAIFSFSFYKLFSC